MSDDVLPLGAFLEQRLDQGPLGSDELLRLLVPLFEQVIEAHQQDRVAPLEGLGALSVSDGRAFFPATELRAPRYNQRQIDILDREHSQALEIRSRTTVDLVEPAQGASPAPTPLVTEVAPITHPRHLGGYQAWEHAIAHHDPLTDVYSLGVLLASFACGLDLRDDDDLERFGRQAQNPFAFNARLHPVIGKLIVRMTELSRRQRAQDLPGLLATLRTYREQRLDFGLDLRQLKGFQVTERTSPHQVIQARLRERLFEISRRNRLLHFKGTLSTLNLTVASVPLLLDYQGISADALFTWQGAIADDLSHEKAISLGRYLRFEDAPYIGPVLDKIRAEDRRNRAEFGFSQMRLALCFLRWHDLKEDKDDRITSPLVLLPVSLERRKGVRDAYVLTPTTDLAEINPVLRYVLRERYGLELPEAIDLGETTLIALFETLRDQIAASEPGVTLRLVDRPQIRLIRERAQAHLDQFRRSSRAAGSRLRSFGPLDYSYDRDRFRPLGLQLFLQRVRPTPLPWRGPAVRPAPRDVLAMRMVGPEIMEEQKYALAGDDDAGPYTWDFDLCSVTLGNFQYRKMSLVRDYNVLLERPQSTHPAFDAIFALTPRPAEEMPVDDPALSEVAAVVPADPTQARAIVRARRPDSYIIQGPPGTGKSQTITNLIADFVSRGQRVLFVCEKRAAIDVVFHRLKQSGLDHLCALIHDSQADKREFILGLKAITDRYLQEPDGFEAADRMRADLLTRIEADLATLDRFSAEMQRTDARHGDPLRELVERLVALDAHRTALAETDAERLPGYAEWRDRRAGVRELDRTLREVTGVTCLAAHPWRWVPRETFQAPRPLELLSRSGAARDSLARVLATAREGGLTEPSLTIGQVRAVLDYLALVRPLIDAGLARLIDAPPAAIAELRASAGALNAAEAAAVEARSRTANWRERLPADEVETALGEARRVEGTLGFLRPAWWRLRKVLAARYDFAKHAVKPRWTAVLEALQTAYQAEGALLKARAEAELTWGTSEVAPLLAAVERIRAEAPRFQEPRGMLAAASPDRWARLRTLPQEWDAARAAIEPIVTASDDDRVADLPVRIDEIIATFPALPEVLPYLARLAADASDALWRAIVGHPLSPDQLEYAIADAAVRAAFRRDRGLMRMNGHSLAEHVGRIRDGVRELRATNARWLAARAHETFRRKVGRSELPAAQLAADEKEWKKRYARGRRELEHEFAKVMRYRSIRELATGDPGLVVADLKPVWLMSPLSVSDALPLEQGLFDVVIFDEASQIPTEEAVPALYRAPKTVVVGDRQQLPPTDFFSTKAAEPDEEDEVVEDDAAGSFELDSDSFLSQSTANLPSTMLSWHYRSRTESLISFSNASFYQGRLLTIPDCAGDRPHRPIVVRDPGEGDTNAEHVLDRPISFHHLRESPYLERRNPGEAAYIARLLRGLLSRERKLSIGVVAFSVAQQTEIERALESLSSEDSDFAQLLEEEYAREEDDQFCGLFVKNLENVQGDERDIVIVSICYGPGAEGKMLMNFGPINKSGGERRLNVVFSRAKRHMVVVSSILHTAITNQYNDGANCLRRYLDFSAAASVGDAATGTRVLEACCPDLARLRQRTEAREPSTLALGRALEARGLDVGYGVGASHFRCDLAVRRKGEQSFRVGVLLDHTASYRSTRALERWVDRPELLRQAGWQVILALGKDVQENSSAVVAHIERTVSQNDE